MSTVTRELIKDDSTPLVDPNKTPDAKKETDKAAPKPRTRTTTKAAQLDAMRETLMGGFIMVGMSLSVPLPLTGHTMIYQAEDMTDSLIAWGKTSPKVARTLLAAGKTSGMLTFLGSCAPLGIAALAELGRLPRSVAENMLPKDLHEYLPAVVEKTTWPEGEADRD